MKTSQKTYQDVIDLISSVGKGVVHVEVKYVTGTKEFLPLDKWEYMRQLKMVDDKSKPFPCKVETDEWEHEDIYIIPNQENVDIHES